MKRVPFGFGWLMAAVMLIALACNCGTLQRATSGAQTAQALATQVEESGVVQTVQAAATVAATRGVLETAQALGTHVEEATTGEVPADIPIYEDGSKVRMISGVISYTARADLATVTTFYQTEMINNGWQQTGEPINRDKTVILVFDKGDQQATVTLLDAGLTTLIGIKIKPGLSATP